MRQPSPSRFHSELLSPSLPVDSTTGMKNEIVRAKHEYPTCSENNNLFFSQKYRERVGNTAFPGTTNRPIIRGCRCSYADVHFMPVKRVYNDQAWDLMDPSDLHMQLLLTPCFFSSLSDDREWRWTFQARKHTSTLDLLVGSTAAAAARILQVELLSCAVVLFCNHNLLLESIKNSLKLWILNKIN